MPPENAADGTHLGFDEPEDHEDAACEAEGASQARRAAMGRASEFFADGCADGMDEEGLVHAALFVGVSRLVTIYGEDPVADYLERLAARTRDGGHTLAPRH